MTRATFMLLGSMLTLTPLVNSQENGSLKINHPATKVLKGAVKGTKNDISQLIDLLLKNGEESPFKEHIAPVLGLPGPMPAKLLTFAEEHHGNDLSEHECYLVYEQSSNATNSQSERPFYIYLHKHKISGHDDESQYFRINLDGRLEKIIFSRAKRDDAGKMIFGSGAASYPDIESSESKKSFSDEMAQMRKWLNAQRKLQAKTK